MRFEKTYRQGGKFTPYTCAPWMVAFGKPTAEVFGKGVSPFAFYYQNDASTVLYEKARFDAVAEAAFEALGKPAAFNALYRKWLGVAKKLESFSWSIYQNKTVPYASLWETFVEFWKHSVFIDCFDAGVDFEKMEQTAKRNGFPQQDVQLLTTPTELSYLQEFEKSANLTSQGRVTVDEFVRQFYWYPTNYVDFGSLRENEARQVIQNRSEKATKTLAILDESQQNLASRQTEVLDAKGLVENPFWFFQRLVAWRDVRKRYNFAGLYGFDTMARKALEEEGIRPELFVALWPEEILQGNLPTQKELQNRKNQGVLIQMGVEGYDIVTGRLAKKMFEKMDASLQASVLELRGQPACLGRVTGPVRVVHAPTDLFLDGEILVTTMTRPEFVPLMRKAAGIITDEGGITSHAAVVSRELNKPCVVGTQGATKRLKTGDVIDLDAFHGLVRKTSHQSPTTA